MDEERKSQAAVECADAHLQPWCCSWSNREGGPGGGEVGTAPNWRKAVFRPEVTGRKQSHN